MLSIDQSAHSSIYEVENTTIPQHDSLTFSSYYHCRGPGLRGNNIPFMAFQSMKKFCLHSTFHLNGLLGEFRGLPLPTHHSVRLRIHILRFPRGALHIPHLKLFALIIFNKPCWALGLLLRMRRIHKNSVLDFLLSSSHRDYNS